MIKLLEPRCKYYIISGCTVTNSAPSSDSFKNGLYVYMTKAWFVNTMAFVAKKKLTMKKQFSYFPL